VYVCMPSMQAETSANQAANNVTRLEDELRQLKVCATISRMMRISPFPE